VADSLRQDRIVRWAPELTSRTIADGVRTSAVGVIPFAQLRRLLDEVITVSEDDIKAAMLQAATRAHIVAEPSGAVSIAALQQVEADLPDDGDTVIVVSGGNVDPELYQALLREAVARS
jgi:threonine dehydratase